MSNEAHVETLSKEESSVFPWVICLLGALFYSYEYYLRITPSVMEHQLMSTFAITGAGFGMLSGLYYYIYTPMQLVVGVMIDGIGARRLLTVACLSCIIGTFLFGFAQVLWLAGIGRLLIGFGSAFAFVGALKLATVWLPADRFAFFSGFVTALGMLGAIIGGTSMTALVRHMGWRNTVHITGIVGLVLISTMYIVFRISHRWHVSANRKRHPNVKVLAEGLIEIIKKPQMWIVGAIGCLLYLPTAAFAELWGIPYLANAHHMGSQQAADANALVFMGWMVGAPIAGWFSDRIRKRRILLTFGALLGVIPVSILLYETNLSHAIDYVCLFMFGFFSSVQVLVFALACELNDKKLSATAMAVTNMFVMLSGLVFQPLMGYLLDLKWMGLLVHGARVYPISDYQEVMSILPAGLFIAAIVSLFLKDPFSAKKLK